MLGSARFLGVFPDARDGIPTGVLATLSEQLDAAAFGRFGRLFQREPTYRALLNPESSPAQSSPGSPGESDAS